VEGIRFNDPAAGQRKSADAIRILQCVYNRRQRFHRRDRTQGIHEIDFISSATGRPESRRSLFPGISAGARKQRKRDERHRMHSLRS
jgi:hypothetical protein